MYLAATACVIITVHTVVYTLPTQLLILLRTKMVFEI